MRRPARRTTTARDHAPGLPLGDPYAEAERPAHPSVCTDCGAVFRGGRWAWEAAPRDAVRTVCAACLRIRDHLPAGHVTLKGPFVEQHLAELRRLVESHAELAGRERPLERVMDIDEGPKESLTITTTGRQLARTLAHAVHDTYEGRLRVRFEADENLVQAVWSR